jgi:uncharacterized phage protein (TIGR02220 family)
MKCECCGQAIPDSGAAALDEIIDYLNQKTGKKFRAVESNRKFVRARIAEGHTSEDMKAVIDRMVTQWANDPKMAQYLRPATLFNAEKFNQYVGELGAPLPEITRVKADWEKVPFDDNSLWDFAKKHGYSNPGSRTNPQYRDLLKREVEARQEKKGNENIRTDS